ncbi:type I-E CRISPR-associated endoribonuclease Cas2e [Xenophilus azovorans]|uniref:type I-E CRISPR-associated endoribonuclease Cas2e n=1 Tax=Xenophilus azovorans TaxID=151755 RepID=UPI000A05B8FF|nr:type I-E CRISPR-associated endoribonuclease Cas2e [Xenophilus azovorans]
MALVMIVIRDVPDRFHGFLSSVMLEVSPNVFVSPRMNPSVRTRVWDVMSDWHRQEGRGSLVMVWRDLNAVGGVGIANLGDPPRKMVEVDGMWLVRRHPGLSENAL